jgi:hypothetical protein
MGRSFKYDRDGDVIDVELDGNKLHIHASSPMAGIMKWTIPNCDTLARIAAGLPDETADLMLEGIALVVFQFIFMLKGATMIPSHLPVLVNLLSKVIDRLHEKVKEANSDDDEKNSSGKKDPSKLN